MTRSKLAQGAVMLTLMLGAACSQILSIEEAHVDPTLTGGAGGTSTSGGGSASAAPPGGEDSEAAGTDGGGTHNHSGGTGASSGSSGTAPMAGSSANGGAPPVEMDLCERYCDRVTTNCKGKYEQYRSFEQCVRVCQALPPGEEGEKDTNTVSCRLRQAELADNEPFLYCKSAGPLGEGKCGSNCISYCSLMQTACTPETTEGNLEPSYFESSQACLTACTELPEVPDGPEYYSSSEIVDPTSFIGNTVFCRAYHLAASLEDDTPTEHCPHAMGGDPCIADP